MTPLYISYFRRLFTRPALRALAAAAISYTVGWSITIYLGRPARLDTAILGLLIALVFLLTGIALGDFFRTYTWSFRSAADDDLDAQTIQETQARYRTALLVLTMVLMVSGVLLTMVLMTRPGVSAIVSVLAFTLALFLITVKFPPYASVLSNMEELFEAIAIGLIVPALGFFVNMTEYHRFLGILALPLLLVYLAWILSDGLLAMQNDSRARTLMNLVGLKRGVEFHHVLLVLAYTWLAVSLFVGVPVVLVWPQLLTLPLAIGKIILVSQLAAGAPPRLKLIGQLGMWHFLLAAYLISFALWMN